VKNAFILSIIIPAYNEEKRLAGALAKMQDYLSARDYKWEIIVVDDGSADRTSDIAKEVIKGGNLMVIKNPTNCGKGYSVRTGVLASKGNIVLFSDADLSTPIEEFDKMLPCIEKGYDIVIGSRMLPESVIEVRQPRYREIMGKTFNILIRTLGLGRFKDTQCGFKCFRREAALKIFNLQKINGFAFDVEILYIAQKFGLKIKDVPVRWINSPDSRVGIVGGSLSMLMALLKIKFYERKGYYNTIIVLCFK